MKDRILTILNAVITAICIVLYIALLVGMFFSMQFIYAIAVPAAGFLLCTLLRILINAPRPYEIQAGGNSFDKKTTGKSFPSRHVFSIFVIATTVFVYDMPYGVILMALGVVMAVIRVMAHVHFVRDVVAGGLLGIAVGSLLYLPVFR